jgi:hypothetical protein
MLKSEHLDRMMKQTSNYVYPKAELHKIEAKDLTANEKTNSSFLLDDTSKEFLEEEISEMRPYCQSSI